MDNFKAEEDETITAFVNKYPLTVPYFQQRKLPDAGLESTLDDFRRRNELTWRDMDRQLQEHMAKTVVPESEDCLTLCLTKALCGKKTLVAITLACLITGLVLLVL